MRRRNGEKKKDSNTATYLRFRLHWINAALDATTTPYETTLSKKKTYRSRARDHDLRCRSHIYLFVVFKCCFFLFIPWYVHSFVCVLALTPFNSDNDRDGTNGDGCANVLKLVLVR